MIYQNNKLPRNCSAVQASKAKFEQATYKKQQSENAW